MKRRLISWASRLFARWSTQPRLTAVTFHRFGPLTGITRELIRHHISFLKEHHSFVLPRDLDSSMPRRRLACVTVDDCHRDIFDHLFSVARELEVPFAIAVPADFFLRQQWLWFDKLYWMLDRIRGPRVVELDGARYTLEPPCAPKELKEYLKRQQPAVRDAALDELAKQVDLHVPSEPVDGYESVTFAQMREMLDSGLVEIMGHTESHTIASVLEPSRLDRELRDSKRDLEAFAGVELPSFCYPNGTVGDFNADTTAAIKRAGFRVGLTSVNGINQLPLDLFLLKRIHAHAVPSAFEKEVSGLGALQEPFRGGVPA
jgi:peptidoglycan/xylan/chitin deacetylase (PgdA/CDA1 family)